MQNKACVASESFNFIVSEIRMPSSPEPTVEGEDSQVRIYYFHYKDINIMASLCIDCFSRLFSLIS